MNKHKGFTLFELLMVLTITCVIVLFSQSGMFSLVSKQRTQSITAQLLSSLAFAKTEAIKRNQMVGICGSVDTKNCSSDWSFGYIIFTFNKITHEIDSVIRYYANDPSLKINSHHQPMITFGADGHCKTRATLTLSHQQEVKQIVIYDSGRARVETTGCS